MTVETKMMELCKNLAIELIPKGITAVGAAHGVPIPPEVTRIVLKTFIELLEEQKKIDNRLDKLIGSYYKVGIDNLTDSRLAEDPKERKRLITTAIDNFRKAKYVEDTLLVIKSQFYIGTCYDLLGEMKLAKSHHEKAYMSAYQRAMQLTKNARIDQEGRSMKMDEPTCLLWWNTFKNADPTDLLEPDFPVDVLRIIQRSSDFHLHSEFRGLPKEILEDRDRRLYEVAMKKWEYYQYRKFLSSGWGSLNKQNQNEMKELGSFSNALTPVLRAYGSTIAS